MLRGYVMGIGDLDAESIQSAVLRAIRESDRLPRPAELRRLAGEVTDPESLAVAAWGDVLRAVDYGAGKPIAFRDATINAAVRLLGGWPAFVARFSGAEAEKWARIDFIKAYRTLASRGFDGDLAKPLAGLYDKTARGGRIVDLDPVVIDCDECRARITAAAIRDDLVPAGLV